MSSSRQPPPPPAPPPPAPPPPGARAAGGWRWSRWSDELDTEFRERVRGDAARLGVVPIFSGHARDTRP